MGTNRIYSVQPPAVFMSLLLAALVAALLTTLGGLASASTPGGFSLADVNSASVQDAAQKAVIWLNADVARAAAHNLTVPVTLVEIMHVNQEVVAGEVPVPAEVVPPWLRYQYMRARSLTGAIYKLLLVLADDLGSHDVSLELLKADGPAYKLMAVASHTSHILPRLPYVRGRNALEVPRAGAYGMSDPSSPQIRAAAAFAVKVRQAAQPAAAGITSQLRAASLCTASEAPPHIPAGRRDHRLGRRVGEPAAVVAYSTIIAT